MVKSAGQYFCFSRLLNQNQNNLSTVTKEGFAYLSMIKRKSKITAKQDHLRMNVALDQTIILGQQIFLDHRSLSSIGQKILMIPLHQPTPFFI